MKNFKLIKRMPIRNVKLRIKPTNRCFLYNFKEAGISKQELTEWFEGRIMDVYQFTGRFGASHKCPWCDESFFSDITHHIKTHGKTIDDLNTKKLGQKAYSLLLKYSREESYDVLGFYVNAECQDCTWDFTEDRANKCQIPEATRSRLRSLKVMGFKCNNFNIVNYQQDAVAFIYKRRPIK
jgi:hypothetical protein